VVGLGCSRSRTLKLSSFFRSFEDFASSHKTINIFQRGRFSLFGASVASGSISHLSRASDVAREGR